MTKKLTAKEKRILKDKKEIINIINSIKDDTNAMKKLKKWLKELKAK